MQPGLLFSLQSALFQKEKLYHLSHGEIPVIDQIIKIYIISEQKYVIGACTHKVRNWGYDGSGENCPKDDKFNVNSLGFDSRQHFEYKYTEPIQYRKMSGK